MIKWLPEPRPRNRPSSDNPPSRRNPVERLQNRGCVEPAASILTVLRQLSRSEAISATAQPTPAPQNSFKSQNILAPLAVKRVWQKADHYWRVIQGLSQALAKKTPEIIAMYLKNAENDHFPLPPDCALQLAAYLLPGSGDRKGSLSISMTFMQKAMMADPANETIYEEICKLPIADADRDGLASLRSRMLADWDGADSSLLGARQAG